MLNLLFISLTTLSSVIGMTIYDLLDLLDEGAGVGFGVDEGSPSVFGMGTMKMGSLEIEDFIDGRLGSGEEEGTRLVAEAGVTSTAVLELDGFADEDAARVDFGGGGRLSLVSGTGTTTTAVLELDGFAVEGVEDGAVLVEGILSVCVASLDFEGSEETRLPDFPGTNDLDDALDGGSPDVGRKGALKGNVALLLGLGEEDTAEELRIAELGREAREVLNTTEEEAFEVAGAVELAPAVGFGHPNPPVPFL